MARTDSCKLILLIFVAIICLVALATKAAHWDKVTEKGWTLDHYDEIYPGLEGCIAIDAIILFFLIVGIVFNFVASMKKYTKYLVILLIVLFIIRIILSILFLAGNNNYVKTWIDYCNNVGDSSCTTMLTGYSNGNPTYSSVCYTTTCGQDWFKTLKGAWGFEIVAIILVNTLGVAALWLMFSGSK